MADDDECVIQFVCIYINLYGVLVRYMWVSMKFHTAPSWCHHRSLAHNHYISHLEVKGNRICPWCLVSSLKVTLFRVTLLVVVPKVFSKKRPVQSEWEFFFYPVLFVLKAVCVNSSLKVSFRLPIVFSLEDSNVAIKVNILIYEGCLQVLSWFGCRLSKI